MGAPVGHDAARVFVPPTKVVVASFRRIIVLGRLALPELPVQRLGDRLCLEGTARLGRSRQRDRYFLQLAEAAVSHQLAGLAKASVAALLRADLKHALGF